MTPLVRVIRNRYVRLLRLRHLLPLRLLHSNLLTEVVHLCKDHLTHLRDIIDNLEVKVECSRTGRLVRSIVPNVQITMFKRFFDGDARGRIERKHFIEQVQRVRVGIREEARKRYLLHVGEIADVVLCPWRSDARQRFFVGRPKVVKDLVELVDIITAFEEGTPTKQLCQDTANGPDINYWCLSI